MANRKIIIENNTNGKSEVFEIEGKDFIACGDGVLAIRDERSMNQILLGPEEWSVARYDNVVLKRVVKGAAKQSND